MRDSKRGAHPAWGRFTVKRVSYADRAYGVGKSSTGIESGGARCVGYERILSSVDAVLGKVITQRPLADAHQLRGVFLHAG